MQTILECKQCGGQLSSEENQKIVYCKFCGSANAISVADRFGLYNRANYLRRQNEFDRALGVYEDIIKEDPTDAEAYFGMALCKYGIEYVDEEETGKKIPTCHRTRFTLMSQDEDFKKAIEYADSDTVSVYMEEASKIDIILKKIQKLSSGQEKYDIFICYKEGDGAGGRTESSVLAQNIYEHLTNKGYNTFFARKTLESKLGSDYEPIIFSALYSAKVMLVVGSKPEEFQAVWVRNEWVRFMERISNGEECTLIPLYKDMTPYELPNELAYIQALDMSKIGFVQDLLDGINKLIKSSKKNSAFKDAAIDVQTANVSGLKKRAFLFLEQNDFASASKYFEKVLDINPEDSDSYWGKLLAQLKCSSEAMLEDLKSPIREMQNFQMAMRFGNEEQKEKYQYYRKIIDATFLKDYEAAKLKEDEKKRIAKEKLKRNKKRFGKFLVFLAILITIWLSTTDSGKYELEFYSGNIDFGRFYIAKIHRDDGVTRERKYIRIGNLYFVNNEPDIKKEIIEGKEVLYCSNTKQFYGSNYTDEVTAQYKELKKDAPRFAETEHGLYCRPKKYGKYYRVYAMR